MDDDLAHRNQTNASCDAQSSLSTSAVRHTEECQRVKGVLIGAADAEFDVPGEPGWSYTRIECCDRETPNAENTYTPSTYESSINALFPNATSWRPSTKTLRVS